MDVIHGRLAAEAQAPRQLAGLPAGHAAHPAAGPVTVRDYNRFAGPPFRRVAVRYMSAAIGSSNA
ncbi:MAG: hypothetical protein ACRDOK_02470 [Streptosporangiaceae bacterium]